MNLWGEFFSEDAYCIGLLYTYFCSKAEKSMALLADLKLFHGEIEKNLENMGSNECDMYRNVWYDEDEPIYFKSYNKDGELYYILKPNFNSAKALDKYINSMSADYLIASRMSNALNCLGIVSFYDNNYENKEIHKEKIKNKKSSYNGAKHH